MATKTPLTDSVLIKNYIAGDEIALSHLIKKYQTRIYSFIYSKTNDREVTEDIFQETFFKVIKTLKSDSYNEEGKFLPWVIRISHNLIVDFYRKNSKMSLQRDSEENPVFYFIADDAPNIEKQMISQYIEQDLLKLIERLPKDQKEIIQLRFFEEKSFKEISISKGISVNTALGRVRYAILNIKKMAEKNSITLSQ